VRLRKYTEAVRKEARDDTVRMIKEIEKNR
jgi:hypothetical protein